MCRAPLGFWGWEDCRVHFLKIQRRVFRAPEGELTSGAEHARQMEWLGLIL